MTRAATMALEATKTPPGCTRPRGKACARARAADAPVAVLVAPRSFAPGYFLEPVLRRSTACPHGWPPHWASADLPR